RFKVTNGVATKYYYFGSQRVAMRDASGVTYLHGDHLGSTSVASNASGALVSRQTYYAFGVPRTTEGTLPTDYTFTGQKNDASDGLMYSGARYYDAAIGRFTQPDSIIPNQFDPQSLNRYAYVRNNPVRYTDPIGHREDCGDDPCPPLDRTYSKVVKELGFNPDGLHTWSDDELADLLRWLHAGVKFTSVPHPNFQGSVLPWTVDNIWAIVQSLNAVKSKYPNNYKAGLGLNGGSLTFNSVAASYEGPGAIGGRYNITTNTITLSLWSGKPDQATLISTIESAIHEMGHAFDAHIGKGNYWSANSSAWAKAIATNFQAAASKWSFQ
ncbi:MAG: hypothetical protein HYR70_05615, partial [Chloroflexi bacterium]|nr:hypothetical protein [Chloroflexota bacterium]